MEDIRGPRFPESSPPSESTSEKKKKSKKKARFPLADIAKVDEAKTGGEPETKATRDPSAIEAALASLAAQKNTEASEKKQPKSDVEKPRETEHETETAESSSEEVETSEHATSEQNADQEATLADSEVYEALPRQDIGAQELGGGEVVLDLQGDEPIAERVLLLQDREPAPAEPAIQPEVIQAPSVEADHDDPEDPPAQTASTAARPTVSPQPATGQGGGNLPPQPPNPNTASVPFPGPNNPLYHNAAVLPPNPNVASAATGPNIQTGPTKQDVEDAAYYAHKAGVRRGLGTGLIVGGAYEHFKHRRREKKAQKEFAQQAKQLEKSNQDLQFSSQEQTKKNQQLQEQAAHSEQVGMETKVNVLPVLQPTSERLPQTTPESHMVAPATTRAEKLVPKKEVLPAQVEGEQIVVPEGHRIETSAWHAIEVDKKTGKAVETPTFQYGREYYRERAQENTPATQKSSRAGGLALTAMAGDSGSDKASTQGNGSSSHIPDATSQGPPSRKQKMAKSAQTMKDSAQSAMSDPAIWPWAVALVVIVITLLILL